jgi:hypothetical protein
VKFSLEDRQCLKVIVLNTKVRTVDRKRQYCSKICFTSAQKIRGLYVLRYSSLDLSRLTRRRVSRMAFAVKLAYYMWAHVVFLIGWVMRL